MWLSYKIRRIGSKGSLIRLERRLDMSDILGSEDVINFETQLLSSFSAPRGLDTCNVLRDSVPLRSPTIDSQVVFGVQTSDRGFFSPVYINGKEEKVWLETPF